ncbi:hypothetical protein [Streptosporangium saharense]|uniref:hypothetical protein n=1 Tax=Streptosporangium saharense TaxID=1706840 RepID=UPI0034443FAB
MSLPCPVPACTRTMPGNRPICRACEAGLLRDLADAPNLDIHLDIAFTRQAVVGGSGGRVEASDEVDPEVGLTLRRTPLPWDQRAREARDVLRSALVGWVRMLLVDQERIGPTCQACDHPSCTWIAASRTPADTLPAMARWLIRQRRALLAHPAAEEAVDEISDAVRQARRAIDRPPATWYAGPCGVQDCAADLYARHGARTIRCPRCGSIHDAPAREAWLMRQVRQQRETAAGIARALNGFHPGLTAEMIRGYAHRLRLFRFGFDALGRPLYLIGDVRDLLDGLPPRALSGPACPACRHPTCRAIRSSYAQVAA